MKRQDEHLIGRQNTEENKQENATLHLDGKLEEQTPTTPLSGTSVPNISTTPNCAPCSESLISRMEKDKMHPDPHADDVDDLDDMYLDVPPSDDDAAQTHRTTSPAMSFRSAISSPTSPEDFDMVDVTPLTSPRPTGAAVTGSSLNHESPMASSGVVNSDLALEIAGMYRILDLVNEQGSGGLVDKIVIAQESLGSFINEVCPGAYASMTKIDFSALDCVPVKPLGIYGSRSEIVRFLQDRSVVNADTSTLLRNCRDDASTNGGRTLRSGIYMLWDAANLTIYALYWPEDLTWNDDAPLSSVKNRVTFMRYLTMIADQLVALISDAHGSAIQWNEEERSPVVQMDVDEDEIDRLFSFEVEKSTEQEEQATTRPGITLDFSHVAQSTILGNRPEVLDPDHLHPKLVSGEINCGISQVQIVQPQQTTARMNEQFPLFRLQRFLETGSFRLSSKISEESLSTLLDCGLGGTRARNATKEYEQTMKLIASKHSKAIQDQLNEFKSQLADSNHLLVDGLKVLLGDAVVKKFSSLDHARLVGDIALAEETVKSREHVETLSLLHPSIASKIREATQPTSLNISAKSYKEHKKRLMLFEHSTQSSQDLSDTALVELFETAMREPISPEKTKSFLKDMAKSAISVFWPGPTFSTQDAQTHSTASHHSPSDTTFIAGLPVLTDKYPFTTEAATQCFDMAYSSLSALVHKKAHEIAGFAEQAQSAACERQIRQQADASLREESDAARESFLDMVTAAFVNDPKRIYVIESVRGDKSYRGHASSYCVSGSLENQSDAMQQYTVHALMLTQSDRHELQIDPAFIPSPKVPRAGSFTFMLPLDQHLRHLQLLPDERCLVITESQSDQIVVFLDKCLDIGRAVENHRSRKILYREKLGHDVLFAYDETKRMLAVCGSEKKSLHLFLFDEKYSTLQGLGTPVELSVWWDGHSKLTHMAFVCGQGEELVMVDNNGLARTYSLTTMQFRPATLQLAHPPSSIHSAPDGSCLLTTERDAGGWYLRAYHWSSFGSTEGICLALQDIPMDSWVVTSMGNRAQMHFVGLDRRGLACQSLALDITRRMTEFTFKETGGRKVTSTVPRSSAHNCLIECFKDVWIRFPVIPAVQRSAVRSADGKKTPTITFVSQLSAASLQAHFRDMVTTFERSTRKPTEDKLSRICVDTISYSGFLSRSQEVSTFKAGEWLVDLLCLIPIHVAVTRDNRFIPLKDGIWSPDLERALLGATVSQIVDNLTFGWYESIFESYMASKPVRVVSSMGEQSVGKSFALNHLVDTSFAGSAMRTTEGVWMSVTPTPDALIVALDFEGVHSIERSAQEDTLLVLFNTALSNLVLFRNNFALSRDIAGLFQSFQSSSTVLDPAANPSLFKSMLMIIIKDVVESDKEEITKEFRLKFQKIVEVEQGSNFISRLHGGKLTIVPWPVIESRQFYTLFPALKKVLDKQQVTHPRAGIFLQTMKTLMAKLKANDWGALDQNLASHRAQQLLNVLPRALSTGATETEPQIEPLKDIDSGTAIDLPDTDFKFYMGESDGAEIASAERERHLQALLGLELQGNDRFSTAQDAWIAALQTRLDEAADLRVTHVREWLNSNTSRFKADLPQLQDVQRAFEALVVAMKANITICGMPCSNCQLACVSVQHHGGPHNCYTSHRCPHQCEFAEDHVDDTELGCVRVTRKLTYARSLLICVGNLVTLMQDQDALDVVQRRSTTTARSICVLPCHISAESPALSEESGSTMEPSICARGSVKYLTISLIPNMFAKANLVHSNVAFARDCALKLIICMPSRPIILCIFAAKTTLVPLYVNSRASVTLRLPLNQSKPRSLGDMRRFSIPSIHKSLSATRVSCVFPPERRRMKENIFIAQSEMYSTSVRLAASNVVITVRFHWQEHETSHGSMSRTKWAVDGPDGTIVEVNGRRFGSRDDGAPMLCSMYCRDMGRHVHIADCRSADSRNCSGAGIEHIVSRIQPNPERAKDFVSHALFWRRTGFKDPYSHDDQATFAKCDTLCSGQEHQPDATGVAHPSYCTLDILHQPAQPQQAPQNGVGYISRDGHHFSCRNPAQMRQAFHVMIVVDRSGSMGAYDRRPLANTPVTNRLVRSHDNRLGAVYSSLYAFWSARHTSANPTGGAATHRRDAYSVILFDHTMATCINNDFASPPNDLLTRVMAYQAGGGTDYTTAIRHAQALMEANWSTERSPVLIFLSDGECSIADETVRDLCNRAVALGRPLSLQTVSFGPNNQILRRMAQIANDVESRAPQDPMHPMVASSYAEALDSVRLAETFLGLADSLRKPRGSLVHI
ncbi:hypothetical protein EIP91_012270 [Steccherinum ochraceum]|uniref:VWFA domain-containing protein n=1 Tax=Steccherinum ochraceum TaxID=92696 RepID=A0A4R0RKX3_9APHY|nr:hypothetical protein EIP91_012270 [Steccherinum ochraceum]